MLKVWKSEIPSKVHALLLWKFSRKFQSEASTWVDSILSNFSLSEQSKCKCVQLKTFLFPSVVRFSTNLFEFYDRKFRVVLCWVTYGEVPFEWFKSFLHLFKYFLLSNSDEAIEFFLLIPTVEPLIFHRLISIWIAKFNSDFYSQFPRKHEIANINETDFGISYLWHSRAQQGSAKEERKRLESRRRREIKSRWNMWRRRIRCKKRKLELWKWWESDGKQKFRKKSQQVAS